MKIIISIFVLLLTVPAFAAELNKPTIINQNQFVLLSDVKESQLQVFLSYTGIQFNQCGIRIRLNHFHRSEDLVPLIDIQKTEGISAVEIVDGQMVARVDRPEFSSFGAFYTILSKTGEPIDETIQQLSNTTNIDAIVENLPCE